MEKEIVQKIGKLISKSTEVLITSHTNPDGDAVGSALALYLFLKKKYKGHINVLIPNEYPEYYAWLPSSEDIVLYSENKSRAVALIEKADILFTLDYNSFNRV